MRNLLLALSLFIICGCSKTTDHIPDKFIKYTIAEGEHFSDHNNIKFIEVSQMNFIVKFDSTAIYQTINPANQGDINKLYGFSEGNSHQYNSARVGWAWYNNALRLYAYVYNNGVRSFLEITQVSIGTEIKCNITLLENSYIFTVNDINLTMSRVNAAAIAKGYQLYPYFGGDEAAPHAINIFIQDL